MTKQQQHEKTLLDFIQKHKIMEWSHLSWKLIGISRTTAYDYKLNESDTIKAAFEQNRSEAVNYMLQKWIKSDNATLQVAAMKICGDEAIRAKLTQQQQHITTDEQLTQINITFPDNFKRLPSTESDINLERSK